MEPNFLHTIPEIESTSYRSSRFSDESDDFGDEEPSDYSSDFEELNIDNSDSIVFGTIWIGNSHFVENSSDSGDSMEFITTREGKSKEMYVDRSSRVCLNLLNLNNRKRIFQQHQNIITEKRSPNL